MPGLNVHFTESQRLRRIHKEEGSGFPTGFADGFQVEAVP
jgi:hypothetical protein